MSQSKNQWQAERWLNTASEDLQAAQALHKAGFHAQACFYAQQSAEKAIKALWYLEDIDPWGHAIQRLVMEFPRFQELPPQTEWIQHAAALDKFYIPTRYPNGLPDLTPSQVYQVDDARHALSAAETLISACWQWYRSHI